MVLELDFAKYACALDILQAQLRQARDHYLIA
jgi:hypothetical protein